MSDATKPLLEIYRCLPSKLLEHPHFVGYKIEDVADPKTGKIRPNQKVPYNPRTGEKAESDNPSTWGAVEAAIRGCSTFGFLGIGFMFRAGVPIIGIDVDHCVIDGILSDRARRIVDAMNTYTEFSPSRTGIHIWAEGAKPGLRCVKRSLGFEMYDQGRYFTLTGQPLPGTPPTIEVRQSEIDTLYREIFGPEAPPPSASPRPRPLPSLDDQAILRKAYEGRNAAEFAALMQGKIDGYPSASEAIWALLGEFAYWTDDPAQIDRLMRHSQLLDLPDQATKWERLGATETAKRIASRQSARERRSLSVKQITHKGTALPQVGGNGKAARQSPPAPEEAPSHPAESQAAGPDAAFPQTDTDNADWFAREHRDALRWCPEFKRWLIWTGKLWWIDTGNGELAIGKAIETARGLLVAAWRIDDPQRRTSAAKWAAQTNNKTRLDAMVELAKPQLIIRPDALDTNPWLFNVENGTIDLHTGDLLPHRREDYITKLSPVVYDPIAACPLFERALLEIFRGREEIVSDLARGLGYTLTGDVREDTWWLLHGSGSNGKSLLFDLLSYIWGDYAVGLRAESVMASKNPDAVPCDIAKMKGARLVMIQETPESGRLAENKIKTLTGGDRVTARFMHQNEFDFTPTHKLFIGTNHKPAIQGTDYGTWRRIRLVPFDVRFIDREKYPDTPILPPDSLVADKRLPTALLEEAPGILAWIVQGCLEWQRKGLPMSAPVRAATRKYQDESDIIGSFLVECCQQDDSFSVAASALFGAYVEWCSLAGEPHCSKNLFGRKLTERGFENYLSSGQARWRGVALLTQDRN